MLDLARLNRIKLSAKPVAQKLVARLVLAPNYGFLPGVHVSVEGFDRLPSNNVIFAMNHTDRFNYWPFQYKLYRDRDRFTSTWVKGKYYENEWVGAFMENTNNLPTVSHGYIITKDFIEIMKRPPTQAEYDSLRKSIDSEAAPNTDAIPIDTGLIASKLLKTRRSILGFPFDPSSSTYSQAINETFSTMMARFVELNEETIRLGLDLLVFPQGTRSISLTRSHIGMAQIALKYQRTIVPVGCNGSDEVYPGSSPFGRRGKIVYRIGKPIHHSELKEFHIKEDYVPFSAEAEHDHKDAFQGVTDLVMERINALVDPRYQFSGEESDRVRGSSRFV